MSAPVAAVALTDDQKWRAWQHRGIEGDRRRGVAMKWLMAIVAITLGAIFGRLL